MADIVVTAAQVEAIDPLQAEIYNFVAASTVTQGQVVYMTTSGTVAPADANGAGLQQARGVALNGGGAGQAISVLKRGRCAGFTLTQDASVPLYLSDTVGALNDAAGTMTVVCGIVITMPDKDATKVFYADFRWGADWA
jgi:hypothetical protein